jgi:GT2 family glycosyltransferase
MFVNDNGPEADSIEIEIKNLIKGSSNFKYYRNKKNLGFLKNWNNAVFNLDKTSNDILLLNSDTIVTAGFLEALLGVFSDDLSIATVSPRSNNATITTIPISSMAKKGINPEESYRLFSKYSNKLPSYNISPVSHGFCLLIRRSIIEEYGLFDEIFGKGYGEEVDFCMRVRQHGKKSAISNRSYVYHMEARSFGADQKKALISENEKVVVKRYPEYRKLVRNYRVRAEDQERTARYGSLVGAGYALARKLKSTLL